MIKVENILMSPSNKSLNFNLIAYHTSYNTKVTKKILDIIYERFNNGEGKLMNETRVSFSINDKHLLVW